MPNHQKRLYMFWQELNRRRVVAFLIGYITFCIAVIPFVEQSKLFALSNDRIFLVYLVAVLGLPFAVVLPWFIYKNRKEDPAGEALGLSQLKALNKETQKHNLPAHITSFIGREMEASEIKRLIQNHRLVSITGTGGCGKTRLTCEVALKLVNDFEDGVWFADLSPITSDAMVAKEVAETLNVKEEPNRPVIETLITHIKERNMLVILDNCEHVIKGSAELTGKLLTSTTRIKILATSREPLNVKGEKIWKIPSLSLPDKRVNIELDTVKNSAAVQLFTDRAQLNNPEFQLAENNVDDVVNICHKLDGIPLALELVASRTRHLDTNKILERITSKFDSIKTSDPSTPTRHRTLLSTLEWSYNLLSEQEKVLFTRLAVFSDGFDLEAVEEVCSDEKLPKEEILDILSALVDRSTVYVKKREGKTMRYYRLETVKQFAKNLFLKSREADETNEGCLDYFISITRQAYNERMSRQAYWMDKIQLEDNNMMAALDWGESNKPEKFQELAANLSWYWGRSNNYSVAIEILERVIAAKINDKETKARLYTGYGSLLVTSGDFQRALDMLKHGLSLWKELKNKKEEAFILAALADLLFMLGDNDSGSKYGNESYRLAIELNDPDVELNSSIFVTFGLVCAKKTKEARPVLKKALKMAEEIENLYFVYGAHHMLGDCALIDGNYIESEHEYGAGLKTTLTYGDTTYTVTEMFGIAMAVAGQGRYAKALRLTAASSALAKSFGCMVPEEIPLVFWHEQALKLIAGTREKLGKKLTNQYEEEGRSLDFEEAVDYALDFNKD